MSHGLKDWGKEVAKQVQRLEHKKEMHEAKKAAARVESTMLEVAEEALPPEESSSSSESSSSTSSSESAALEAAPVMERCAPHLTGRCSSSSSTE